MAARIARHSFHLSERILLSATDVRGRRRSHEDAAMLDRLPFHRSTYGLTAATIQSVHIDYGRNSLAITVLKSLANIRHSGCRRRDRERSGARGAWIGGFEVL